MDHVQRVKDLLAVAAKHAGEAEGDNAAAMAAKLMAKYAITEAQAQTDEDSPREIAEMEIMIARPFARLKAMRAAQVAGIFGAKVVILNPKRSAATRAKGVWGLALFASPESADSVQALLSLLWVQLERVLARAVDEQEELSTANKRGIVNGWFVSVIDRLTTVYGEAVAEAESDKPGTDVVLRRDAELAEDARNAAFPKLRSMKTKAAMDADGFVHGLREGRNADIGITAAASGTGHDQLPSGLIENPDRKAIVGLVGSWVRVVLSKPWADFEQAAELVVHIDKVDDELFDADEPRSFVVTVAIGDGQRGILFADGIASIQRVTEDGDAL